jgi:hypothetical protein
MPMTKPARALRRERHAVIRLQQKPPTSPARSPAGTRMLERISAKQLNIECR